MFSNADAKDLQFDANEGTSRIPTYKECLSCAYLLDEDVNYVGISTSKSAEQYRPSLLRVSVPPTCIALCDDSSNDVVRGEQLGSNDSANDDDNQESMETESTIVLPVIPSPVLYNDCPYPHQENLIHITLETTKDMHGASVTVETNNLHSFLPPSDAIIHPFSIQESGYPLPACGKWLYSTTFYVIMVAAGLT